MIRYATDNDKQAVWNMWKRCFGDCDAYMEIYFREKYRAENTLLYVENAVPIASLQMLPFQFSFHEKEIPIAYFSGLCTLPQARKQGYMALLIRKAYEELAKRAVPLAVLVPQERWLLDFYDKYGFAQTFDAGTQPLISLKDILQQNPHNLEAAYRTFDAAFRNHDMTVQKTPDDFRAIVEEGTLFGFPPKKNLFGMARVIDAETLLSIFASCYPQKQATLRVVDADIPNNDTLFSFRNGTLMRDSAHHDFVNEIDIRILAQCLLGYHTTQKKEPFRSLFPEKVPWINYMLE